MGMLTDAQRPTMLYTNHVNGTHGPSIASLLLNVWGKGDRAMPRKTARVAVLRMTSWPVLIILTLALLLALGSYWLRVDAMSRGLMTPALVGESTSIQPDAVVLQPRLP
jgi:hypothetical protein